VQRWKQNLRTNTVRTYRMELKVLLRTLETFGAPQITLPKIPWRQRTVTASGEELAKLLKQPPPWLRLYMLLYFQCGLRHSETLRVTPRTWDREHHTVTVEVKGGRQRTVLVSEDVEALMVSAGDPEPDTPFLWTLRGHKLSGHSLSNAFIRHKILCGVNPALTAHDLRRTAATILYTATKDLRVAQELLGHKNLTSTLTYIAPLNPDDARKYSELLRFEHFKSETKQ
jgi:integrase